MKWGRMERGIILVQMKHGLLTPGVDSGVGDDELYQAVEQEELDL